MKKCPNWKSPADGVSGWWKQQLLQYLGGQFNIKTFVETGTCEGSTVAYLAPYFDKLYTIELADYYYDDAVRRLNRLNITNVMCFKGDSRKILPNLLRDISNQPTLFWLDAHSSGGMTADAGDPLAEELQVIMSLRPDALIVIDDMKDGELRHCVEAGVDFAGWIREYRTGEVLVYPEGRYQIPPFEDWRDS